MTAEKHRTSAAPHEALGQIIKIEEAKIRRHLKGLVRQTVRGTLNQMPDPEAREMRHAQRHERTGAPHGLAGFCRGALQTQTGEVRNLSVPAVVGIGMDRRRETPGLREGPKEDAESWRRPGCDMRPAAAAARAGTGTGIGAKRCRGRKRHRPIRRRPDPWVRR